MDHSNKTATRRAASSRYEVIFVHITRAKQADVEYRHFIDELRATREWHDERASVTKTIVHLACFARLCNTTRIDKHSSWKRANVFSLGWPLTHRRSKAYRQKIYATA